jgi:hypothetical protein
MTKNADQRTAAPYPPNGRSPGHGVSPVLDMHGDASRGAASDGEGGATSAPLSPPGFLPNGYRAHVVFTDDGAASLCAATADFTVVSAAPLGVQWTTQWTLWCWMRVAARAWAHFRSSTQPEQETHNGR